MVRVDDRPIARRLLDPAIPEEDAAHQLAAWLLSLEPQPDPIVARVAALVERAEDVGPKWVVRRHRPLDVAAAANVDDEVSWAALAAELGYTDQSHIIRHFRAVVGESPARYAEKRGAL